MIKPERARVSRMTRSRKELPIDREGTSMDSHHFYLMGRGKSSVERKKRKIGEKSSGGPDGSSGRHTSFKATFRSTHLESGTCRDRRQIE